MKVLVVGSGISGLSSAIRLVEAGHEVTIRTAAGWRETVSAVAAAIWYPFRAYPLQRVEAWSRTAFEVFASQAADPASGVRMTRGRAFWGPLDDGAEVRNVPSPVATVASADIPPMYTEGIVTTVPVVEMPIYLAWLVSRLGEMGVAIEQGGFDSLDEALARCPVVVNCSGLGAAALVPDPAVEPIRGQVVRVENPGITEFTLDAGEHTADVTYVIPRSRDVVLGGTAEASASLRPDEEVARQIVERCTALEPALEGARVLGHAVGLRPGRPEVRVETERRAGGAVVHNYGHGGSGVTVCWGCADEVAQLVSAEGVA